MVDSEDRFLIDAAFIVERTHRVFCGAPLITAAGRDHTFIFGCVRDFLRLRRNLAIKAGIVVLGKDAYSVSTRDSVLDLVVILNELEIPHVHDPLNLGLHVIGSMCSGFTHIVTDDKRLLQFVTNGLAVLLPRRGTQNEWDWMSPATVKATLGVAPKDVPTYLALTASPSSRALTNIQATRLIESYGDVDSIYRNLAQVASLPIRRKLAESETSIRQCYATNRSGYAGSPRLIRGQIGRAHV